MKTLKITLKVGTFKKVADHYVVSMPTYLRKVWTLKEAKEICKELKEAF